MYYVNRVELGRTLAQRMIDLKGREAVVIALKESSLSACIGLASEINAWVFPLLSKRITIPGDPRVMGLIDTNGVFTWSPELEKMQQNGLEMESRAVLEDAKRQAFSELNRSIDVFGSFSKDALNGRTLLLAGDIVEDRLEIAMALEYLKSVRYEKLYGVGGNVDVLAATFYQQQTDNSIVLDVITHMFPADHYFEQSDSYTPEEQRQLAMNISQYWV